MQAVPKQNAELPEYVVVSVLTDYTKFVNTLVTAVSHFGPDRIQIVSDVDPSKASAVCVFASGEVIDWLEAQPCVAAVSSTEISNYVVTLHSNVVARPFLRSFKIQAEEHLVAHEIIHTRILSGGKIKARLGVRAARLMSWLDQVVEVAEF